MNPVPSLWELLRQLQGEVQGDLSALEERVRKVETRMNIALGGIGVIGVTAIINLITNAVQTMGGIQ